MTANNRISNLIGSQLPAFVTADHAQFVRFLEAYYEYLEQASKTVERLKNIRTYRDVDLTEDQFSTRLYSEFMKYIPDSVIVDKDFLLKHIRDFYRAKGTEKSTRFLMRILFNKEIDFYYPKKDVLRASDGKWFVQKALRITNTKIDSVPNTAITGLEKYVGNQIRGLTSNTTALIERVDRFYELGAQIDELVLSNINGDFTQGEIVVGSFVDGDSLRDIRSNTFSGGITTIQVVNPGTGYSVGDPVVILSSRGSGACASIASVTTGNITGLTIVSGGAGYRISDAITITGGTLDANGSVTAVNLDESIHPNTYNIVTSTISLEANTQIGNTQYSNLNHCNANSTIANAVSYWVYGNTGPISAVILNGTGANFTGDPDVTVAANTQIYAMGILGRMEIVNGGQNYRRGDQIEFLNDFGCWGVGALGNVVNVDASQGNTITGVRFIRMTGHTIGGAGYNPLLLPRANVLSVTGNGANIVVRSILGSGADLETDTSTIGAIERIVVLSRGGDYEQGTTIDLSGSGDGEATANVSIVSGVFAYPGRYLNDDGHLSSYNFLEDRDYYQDYSYVVRSTESIHNYRKAIKDLTHPAGMKLFGEYLYINEDYDGTTCLLADSIKRTTKQRTYQANSTFRTNLVLYNTQFDKTAAWVDAVGSSSNVTGNYAVAPDHTFTADRLRNINGGVGDSLIRSVPITIQANTRYTGSLYVKQNNSAFCVLAAYLPPVENFVLIYVFSTGQFTQTQGAPVLGYGSEPAPEGFTRLWYTLSNANTTLHFDIRPDAAVNNSDFLIWGAQLELGNSPSPLIKTTGVPVTKETATINVAFTSHGFANGANLGLEFTSGSINVHNGIYTIGNSHTNYFTTEGPALPRQNLLTNTSIRLDTYPWNYVAANLIVNAIEAPNPYDYPADLTTPQGALLEPASTNLIKQSQSHANTVVWETLGINVAPSNVLAPDKTATAYLITETSINNQHLISQPAGANVAIGEIYTWSTWLKANTQSLVFLTGYGDTYAVFDLTNGTYNSGAGTHWVMIPYDNGWYRCATTVTKAVSGGQYFNYFYIGSWRDGVGSSYAGDTTKSFYVWGSQLESGDTLTSYIPTTDARVTRAARYATPAARTQPLKADKFVEGSANVQHFMYNFSTSSANGYYKASVFAKAAEREKFNINLHDGTSVTGGYFSLASGNCMYITTDSHWLDSTATIDPYEDGWYRCSISARKASATAAGATLGVLRSNNETVAYQGDGTSGIYLWDLRLETAANSLNGVIEISY